MKVKKLLSANFKHFIEFIENKNEQNIWMIKCRGFAQIEALTDQNFSEYDGINFGHLAREEYFVITLRYLPIIHKSMRIRFRNRLFTIKRIINPSELNHILKIIAQEITE
ncbi:MAG: head-tail adaptor protein [Rickettsiaceae bacterium]|nr:head-tail adaptor protein [Rickettsiaceae bacterium]